MADALQFDRQAAGAAAAAQARAADPRGSAWVSASAGTGKTKVLTDRVLRLLLAGSAPGEILCLTFTKAAAAEMANRLFRRLAHWATLDNDALFAELEKLGVTARERIVDRARGLFAAVLDCPGGMRIQTIHSFCQSLLARFPIEAGLPPGFQVLEERAATALAHGAFDAMLTAALRAHAPPTDFSLVLLRLLELVGERELRSLLMGAVLHQRDALTRREQADDLQALATVLKVRADADEASVLNSAIVGVPFTDMRALCTAAATGSISDQKLSRKLDLFLAALDEGRERHWDSYAAAFLTQKGEPTKTLLTKGTAEKNPDLLDAALREQARVIEIEDQRRRVRLLAANRDFQTVARGWLRRVESAKQREAALDFHDLIESTRTLLNDDSRAAWVLYRLDAQLRHILVDEAQDTSRAQWEIVEALAREFFAGHGTDENKPGAPFRRTLFVVGDEKQSIYGFQGADPASFAQAQVSYQRSAEVAGAPWNDVPLALSFRSTGAVLDTVNQVFADEQARAGVSALPIDQQPARKHAAGLVEVWPPLCREKGEVIEPWALPLTRRPQRTPGVRLAQAIARRIAALIERREMLPARGRAITAGDIMVLVPRRTPFFAQLIRALKDVGVPVAGLDRLILAAQPAVQDLLALLNFLLLPEDDLTLAMVLKSPLVGCSEEALFDLCHARSGTVWAALQRRQHEDGWAPVVDWLAHWRNRVEYRRPHELLQEVLTRPCPGDTISARRALVGRLGYDALDPLDEFLAEAVVFEERMPATLQHFVAWVGDTDIQKKREQARPSGEVRIMTAHGSKGLEAPVVFLVDLPSQPPSPSLLPDGAGGPLLYLPFANMAEAVAKERQSRDRAAQAAERRRLLYVALTRAEDRLYVCGAYPEKMPDNAWHTLIAPAVQALGAPLPFDHPDGNPFGEVPDEARQVWRYETAQGEPVAAQTAVPATPKMIVPAWARQPIPSEPPLARPLTPSDSTNVASVPMASPATRGAARRFQRGELTHALLQHLPDLPEDQRAASAARYLDRAALDLDAGLRVEIAAEALAVISQPDFAPLFGPGSLAEVPLVGLVSDQVVSGQVDRLLVTDTAIHFVDYKTNRPPPMDLVGVPEAYRRQLAYYAALLRAAYPGRAVHAALLWTDGPRLLPLPEDWLAQALQSP